LEGGTLTWQAIRKIKITVGFAGNFLKKSISYENKKKKAIEQEFTSFT